MRPYHDQDAPDDEGRIIYLGDVRRRRAAQHRKVRVAGPAALTLAALGSWSVWIFVLFHVPPSRLLTYMAFFLPLWMALSCTTAIALGLVRARQGAVAFPYADVRRAAIGSAALIANLAVCAAHRWTLPVAGASVFLALVLDGALSRRRDPAARGGRRTA